MVRSETRKWYLLVAGLVSVSTILLAYSNFHDNSFHFDDSHVIRDNLYIRSLDNVPQFFTDAGTGTSLPANAAYRPIVPLTLAIDYRWGGGLDPRQFRRTQLFLLLWLGTFLFLFYRHLAVPNADGCSRPILSLYAATFFCLHTTNTETMNIVCHRSELLSALGILGAFLVYLSFPRWRRTYAYLIPMVFGNRGSGEQAGPTRMGRLETRFGLSGRLQSGLTR